MLNLTELIGFGAAQSGLALVGTVTDKRAAGSGPQTFSLTSLGLQQNDIVVCVSMCTVTTDRSVDVVSGSGTWGPKTTDPNLGNWTLLADLFSNDTHDVNFFAGWFRCGASPSSSIILEDGGAPGAWQTLIMAFRGVDTVTAMDATATTATGTNGSQADPPSITPVTAGALILAVGAAARATGAAQDKAISSGMNSVYLDYYDDTHLGILGAGTTAWTSGAYNPAAWTGTTAVEDSWCALTLALRPA